ncbi:hypothetical protein LCGC14_0344550 [marine sediment metagenome]|uniref:Uncharacterized protein n=1 Tax=marine sediment metagenome TaxID=412755 RepID=A0A0F9TIB6_9ZZZZ
MSISMSYGQDFLDSLIYAIMDEEEKAICGYSDEAQTKEKSRQLASWLVEKFYQETDGSFYK